MKDINLGETIGIRRKFDKSGRIVIPKEHKKTLGIKENDEAEIFLLKDGIFIKRV